ncbi:Fic family protein [Kocuria rhizophila]|uniref:Fic family protein n=1 Tax=Kocuria rhizophila TaxID=72000 RepID=UPI002ED258E8|nr:Fic family protein [Kocuria rhizophila]
MQPMVFPEVDFASALVTDLFALERVRVDFRTEHLDDPLGLELRRLFQGLTSVMSARIEGNRTTVADVVAEARRAAATGQPAADAVREILQLEQATDYMDELAAHGRLSLTQGLIRELHQLAVQGLEREGDEHPGSYRTIPVGLAGASHVPPAPGSVQADMDQLLEFANKEVPAQHQLLQIALVHHRFVWIHPFANGNGRVSRLLTYAMLSNQGYTSRSAARPLNPTAVFGADRQSYYNHLAGADSLSPEGVLAWAGYVIHGLKDDMDRVSRLAAPRFISEEVVGPSVNAALAAGELTETEADVIYAVARQGRAKAGDLEDVIKGSPSNRSHRLRRMVESGLLQKMSGPGRYVVSLHRNVLTKHVVHRLNQLDMLPAILRD